MYNNIVLYIILKLKELGYLTLMVIKKVIEKDEIIMNYLISYCLYSVGDEFQRSTFVVSLYLNHLDPVYI